MSDTCIRKVGQGIYIYLSFFLFPFFANQIFSEPRVSEYIVLTRVLTIWTDVSADFAMTIVTTMVELSVGFSCACLPSAKFAFDRATSTLNHTHQNWFGRERPALRERKYSSTVSTLWESIRSKVTTRIRPGSTITGGLQSSRASRRPGRRGRDVELGHSSSEPVVFQQRLDAPSLRSTSDVRSYTSRGGDHRGLSDAEFAHCMQETSSQNGQDDDFNDSKKGLTIDLEDMKR
jgi:hypothetical protein